MTAIIRPKFYAATKNIWLIDNLCDHSLFFAIPFVSSVVLFACPVQLGLRTINIVYIVESLKKTNLFFLHSQKFQLLGLRYYQYDVQL